MNNEPREEISVMTSSSKAAMSLLQAALAQVVKAMDETNVTQEQAIQLVVNEMALNRDEAKRLSDAYDAM